jgi:hypothetical protein
MPRPFYVTTPIYYRNDVPTSGTPIPRRADAPPLAAHVG